MLTRLNIATLLAFRTARVAAQYVAGYRVRRTLDAQSGPRGGPRVE